MRLQIAHDTFYHYDSPLAHSTQYLRLTPRPARGQQVLSWQLALPASASACMDAFGNTLHVLSLDGPRRDIHLHAQGEVLTDDGAPLPDPETQLPVELFLRDTPLTRADDALRHFAAGFAQALRADPHMALLQLMQALGECMPYQPGRTDVATPAAQAFASGQGVCQDHAHVLICCARLLGLPARYVSGYLATDASHVASHAWAEIRLPPGHGAMRGGWLGYDVSNQGLAGGHHVRLAYGADYLDACPVRGVRVGGGAETLKAVVSVTTTPAGAAAQQ